MDLELDAADCELRNRTREFCQRYLFPVEQLNEDNGGGLPETTLKEIRGAVIDYRLGGMNHSVCDGGQGYTILQQCIINEELGKTTGCLWDIVWIPAYCLRFGNEEQKERYLRPTNRGERRDAIAITEPEAGSDARNIRTTATPDGDNFILNGEKWFITAGDIADYFIVQANVSGDPTQSALFLVDKKKPGVTFQRQPRFMHNAVYGHPEYRFENVRVGRDQLLGEVGAGFDLTKQWFVEARLAIAARCVGAAIRASQLATDFAASRRQFGQPIQEFQGVGFMLADMAVELMAAKTLLYRVAADLDRDGDLRRGHAHAAALKLYCSEVAGRVIDKAVQIHGGRGYRRDNPVERLYRDIRVDRIWEGTSEIQRAIIAGQIARRGMGLYAGWGVQQ